jgi:hypothetical protein
MTPLLVGAQTPVLAVIDSQLDTTHPEASAGNLVATSDGPVTDEHGTAVAATAAAPANGRRRRGAVAGTADAGV